MGEKVASLAAEEPVQILQMSTTFGKCRLALCEGRAFPVSAQDCFQHLHDQFTQAAWNMCVMLAAQVDLLPSAARLSCQPGAPLQNPQHFLAKASGPDQA